MQYSYRITKYPPSENSYIFTNEWSSFFDVGEKVSLEDYIKVEDEYISIILFVCDYFKIEKINISDIEIYQDGISINKEINIDNVANIVRLILRESIWAKLKTRCFEFHFGYDFYMYLMSDKDIFSIITEKYPNLRIEEFLSPYR